MFLCILNLQYTYFSKYKDTDDVVGVINTRSPQLMVLTPEYARAVYVTEFRRFHDNEMSRFVSTVLSKERLLYGKYIFFLPKDQ